jgi:polynucleotide 5'-kinase involved in rRNA processing
MQQGNSQILSIQQDPTLKNAVAIGYLHGKGKNTDKFVMMNRDGTDEGEIRVDEGEKIAIEPNHDPKGRDVIMVGGKSGSGKSFIARNFAVRYHELYPDRKIRFISYF